MTTPPHPLLALRRLKIRKALGHPGGLSRYLRDYRRLIAESETRPALFEWGRPYPVIDEWASAGGVASGHYFHQDLLVAQRVFWRNPRRHADIGSRVDGFVAHVAVFREIEVFDIRPIEVQVTNVRFRQMNAMGEIDPALVGAYDSVSCLHALEHFGLGRYGDPIDYMGFLKGFRAISSLVAPGGVLYLSVPMGRQRIEFNAHRVFALGYLRQMCQTEGDFRVERFSYVDDNGNLHDDAASEGAEADRSYDCRYGLAILELRKP
jgi:SAM-dependent methyltransferase